MNSNRIGTGLMLACVLMLSVGCSSLGLGDCETCDVPAPEPACEPPPADCAPPAATPVANRPPANGAAPGQVWCYVKVPAVVENRTERVCVQPACTTKEWVPPVTKQVTKRVCVREPKTQRIEVPAQYEQRTRQVCVDKGRTEWARVECAGGATKAQEELGECWMLQQVPPTFETKVDTVCTRPASFREEVIPGEYKEVVETVEVKPGYEREIPVPAVYEERVRQVVVQKARWEWRRNNTCEVPGAAQVFVQQPTEGLPPAGMTPAATGPTEAPNAMQPVPQPASQPIVPAPQGNPQGVPVPVTEDLPPAGELPPVPTFDDK